MSIPPLVCSTPPPPDQCEDEKDPEEFDLHYLSQEDYDENYDYGNFSTYNHFQSTDVSVSPKVKDKNHGDISQKNVESIEIQESNATAPEVDTIKVVNNIENHVNNIEEDVNIEDLDLKLDEEPLVESEITEINISIDIDKSKHKIARGSPNIDIEGLEHNDLEPVPTDEFKEPTSLNLSSTEDSPVTSINNEDNLRIPISATNVIPISETNIDLPSSLHVSPDIDVKHEDKNELCPDDDFTDFDDFQFASSSNSNAAPILESCDNPWDSKQEDNDTFGDFKANFEESGSSWQTPVDPDVEHSKEDCKNEVNLESIENDDEFGDFDDFKSSAQVAHPTEIKEEFTEQQVPVFNLTSPENEKQFLENINNVLNSIFEYEITEPENKFEGKLESMLGETWGHILETDVRQPYMVNWNSSLGQKTLLKSLRIDSRNILFGPKWSYNMPKYAANLSTAPLQPVKQSDPVTTPPIAEKSEAKPTTAWSDPFTSDGQESCNTEPRSSNSENPVIETGPTDLDVFEGSLSKPDNKIYSSTLNVQPIRQINLPDTHIFTPTDSETPRSKTIHYDSTPAILLPHKAKEEKKQADLSPQLSASSGTGKTDDDYWDFQDYKGTMAALTTTVEPREESKPPTNSTITFGTQVLQPIKIEPITIPTLNWPDPGEIKETFEDFSDFISNSTWNNDGQSQTEGEASKSAADSATVLSDGAQQAVGPEVTTAVSSNSFDDDFDTFQSAVPAKVELSASNTEGITGKPALSAPSQNISEINAFQSFKYDSLSFGPGSSKVGGVCSTMPKTEVVDNISSKNDLRPSPSTSLGVNLLQPTPAAQNQQKSGQILQPLSLENYYSQINWPSPGIDLQDLSRFNPVETLNSLKTDLSTNSHSKVASPAHSQKSAGNSQLVDDDWGDFVSSKPAPKKPAAPADDDEWTDFVCSPALKPHNGLNTISLNVQTNLNIKKSNQNKLGLKGNHMDIPSLNYITPKTNTHKTYNDRHFQNL